MTYVVNGDGTVQVLSSPNTAICQGRIMTKTPEGYKAISKSQLGKLFT